MSELNIILSEDDLNPEEDLSILQSNAQAVQLVTMSEYGSIQLCPQGVSILKAMPGPLVVVSVGGPVKSGKSTLLNLILDKPGFKAGSSWNMRTQGIWIWGHPLKSSGVNVLLVDSEGSDTIDTREMYNAKLLTILILLSKIHIVNGNSYSPELITQFKSIISANNILGSLKQSFPSLIWLTRDSKEDPSDSRFYREVSEILTIQRVIDTPTFSNDKELPSAVVKAVEQVKAISLNDRSLREGRHINGSILVKFLESIVQGLNENEVPRIGGVWDSILQEFYDELYESTKNYYKKFKLALSTDEIVEESEIISSLLEAKEKAVEFFKKKSLKSEIIDREIMAKIDKFHEQVSENDIQINRENSEAFNLKLVSDLFRDILNKMNSEYYMDNFEELETDWSQSVKEYEILAKGPTKLEVLCSFSVKYQHQAFATFFDQINDKLHLQTLNIQKEHKSKQKKIEEKQENLQQYDDRNRVIESYVKDIQHQLAIEPGEGEDLNYILRTIHDTLKQNKSKYKFR